jgi:hypothetical protein
MSFDRPPNTWWRRVPRSRGRGVFTVSAVAVAIVLGVYALATGAYDTTSGVVLETIVVVLLAWVMVTSLIGLAALRRR